MFVCMDVTLKLYTLLVLVQLKHNTTHPGYKADYRLRWDYKLSQFQIHPPLTFLLFPVG